MKPTVIYLTDTSFGVLPFDKSEERVNDYISIEYLKNKILELNMSDNDRLTRGYNAALYDLLIQILKEKQK